MEDSDWLLKLIDSRVEKILRTKGYTINYVGTVVSVVSSKKSVVKIAGFDTEFTLLNKSNETLYKDDNVIIECIGGNLSNGFISHKFN